MSFIPCLGCEAMVDPAKAYCPDCGMPVDEEQQRDEPSEFDSQIKTQNVTPSARFRLIKQFKLSAFFKLPNDVNEPKAVENKKESSLLNVPSETRIEPKHPDNRLEIKKGNKLTAKINQLFGSDFDSKRLLYVTLGVISLVFVLALIFVIILSSLLWDYSK